MRQRIKTYGSIEYRFWHYTKKTDTCWLFRSWIKNPRHHTFMYQGKRHLAHRYSYELHIGPIPQGYEVDHACRVKNCVNPAHLRLALHAQNMQNQPPRKGSSDYRGVYWDKARKMWTARGHKDYKGYFLGRFEREEEAGQVALEWRLKNLPFTVE